MMTVIMIRLFVRKTSKTYINMSMKSVNTQTISVITHSSNTVANSNIDT